MAENEVLLKTLNQILSRLSTIEDKLEIEGDSNSSSGKEDPRSIRAYDAFLRDYVDSFEAKGQEIGGKAADLGRLVKEAFVEKRTILYCAAECKAPANMPQDLMPLLKPMMEKIKAVGALRMRDDFEFHCRAVEELLSSLNWLLITPAPRDYVETFIGGSDLWANKIRMKYRGNDANQIAFCDALKKILQELMVYIKEYHTTGLAWNKKSTIEVSTWQSSSSNGTKGGEETKEAVNASGSTTSSSNTPPPPPTSQETGGGKAALFGELSQGLNITSGLKKVTKDMIKNDKGKPALTPTTSQPKKPLATKTTQQVVREPSTTYNAMQFKWDVCHHMSGIVNVKVESNKESVYIFKCGNAVIDIRGTGKSILIDGCNKTQILCDEMISTVEFVNCKNVKFQVRETVPTITIDKTDSIVTYLSWKSMGCNFVTSKSSDMNVSYPKSEGSDDMEEKPIPEQFSSVLKRKEDGSVASLETEVSDLYA